MRILALLSLVILLNGCKLIPQDPYSDLYLRSEFTWWEAKPEFKFSSVKDSLNKTVTAKIQSDGNPYNIKIADKSWSKNSNCGYKNTSDRVIKLNTWLELDCDYDFAALNTTPIQKPFSLKPSKTGVYTFTLKMTTQSGEGKREVTKPTHLMVRKVG